MPENLFLKKGLKSIFPGWVGGGLMVLLCSCMLACSGQQQNSGLTIACAASLQFAVRDLAETFGRDSQEKIEVITGSSGRLTTQLMNGAPFDVFFSANMSFPELLFREGRTTASPEIFGLGIPVIWTLREDLDLENVGDLLTSSAVEKIAIADPKHAPFGAMAEEYFKDNQWYDTIESKLVFGENVSQVNEYILNRTVDVGLSSKSIVSSPKLKGKGQVRELEKAYWIEQGLVSINNGHSKALKNKFLQFVKSEKGRGILKNYGFAF